VATVVPWMKRSTSAGRAPASASTWLTAAPMPSRRSFGVLGTFVSTSRPRAVEGHDVGEGAADVHADLHRGPPWRGPGYHTAMRDLLDRLDGWRDEQIEFLARLVNHDSGTDDVLDVNGVGAILVERLEGLGFGVRRVVNEPLR